jgi:hypothetical protein
MGAHWTSSLLALESWWPSGGRKCDWYEFYWLAYVVPFWQWSWFLVFKLRTRHLIPIVMNASVVTRVCETIGMTVHMLRHSMIPFSNKAGRKKVSLANVWPAIQPDTTQLREPI